jgi:hypothetical protein
MYSLLRGAISLVPGVPENGIHDQKFVARTKRQKARELPCFRTRPAPLDDKNFPWTRSHAVLYYHT